MPLPPAKDRQPAHLRTFRYEAFLRDDGLWDIDATIQDSKPYLYYEQTRGTLEPGEFLHNISARLTFDPDMIVKDISVAMDDIPFSFCSGGAVNAPRLIGCHLMRGWRKALGENLGGTAGCTHLKEMLANMSTVAYQTVTSWAFNRSAEALAVQAATQNRPLYIGGCHSMATDGPVIAEHFPQFADKSTGEE